MEEEDFPTSMVVVITGVDEEVMDRDNSMNKGMSYNVTIAEGMGTQNLIVGTKINE